MARGENTQDLGKRESGVSGNLDGESRRDFAFCTVAKRARGRERGSEARRAGE